MIHSSRLRAALLATLLAFGAAPAQAQSAEAAEAGWGAGAAVSTVLYAPLKLIYAGSGLLVGGLAWALSAGDPMVARAVISPAVGGDYVITPAILRGERRLAFVGGAQPADGFLAEGDRTYEYPGAAADPYALEPRPNVSSGPYETP